MRRLRRDRSVVLEDDFHDHRAAEVAVSGKTSTGLTVNLHGYTQANGYPDQWSVRVVRPDGSGGYTGSACQTLPRATTSATVTGLDAGKSYTIQINKLASCYSFANIVNETPVTTVSMAERQRRPVLGYADAG